MKSPIIGAILASLLVAMAVTGADAGTDDGLAEPPRAVLLREKVIVNSNVIRLGDLFANIGELANARVAYAPAPGRRAVFDARWLYYVARRHGLKWRPMTLQDQAVVERDSIAIERSEIKDHILAALVERGVDARRNEIQLGNRNFRLHVAADEAPTVGVDDVVYDPRTRRFSAVIAAPANDSSAPRVHVTGRVHRVAEVPVLARRILRGDVIGPADIEWVRFRSGRLPRDTILDAEDLLGRTPVRGMRAGAPVRTAEVRWPILVPKGSLVTMMLKVRNMTLTAQGNSMQDGARGDVIRISNADSSTIVEAVVTGPGWAEVKPTGHLAMN